VNFDHPIIGLCIDYPRVICFSQNQVGVWNIQRVETHFAKTESPVIKMLRLDYTSHERVSNLEPRIMVVGQVSSKEQ